MKLCICIEGNIGSGKTTLARALKEMFERISSGENHNIFLIEERMMDLDRLSKYNANPKEEAFSFQQYMNTQRLEMIRDAKKYMLSHPANVIVIMDTGPLREYAFTLSNMSSDSSFNSTVANQHLSTFAAIIKNENLLPDLTILLDPSEKQCLRSIEKRARGNENLLKADYLHLIRSFHKICLEREPLFQGHKYKVIKPLSDDDDGYVQPERVLEIVYTLLNQTLG